MRHHPEALALPSDGSLLPAIRVPFLRVPPFSCFSASCVLSFTQPCGSSLAGWPSLAPCCLPSSSVGPGVEQLLRPCLWSALSEAAALQGGVTVRVPVSWRVLSGGRPGRRARPATRRPSDSLPSWVFHNVLDLCCRGSVDGALQSWR